MRKYRDNVFLPKVKILVELPAWEHSLFLTLFVTTSGGL